MGSPRPPRPSAQRARLAGARSAVNRPGAGAPASVTDEQLSEDQVVAATSSRLCMGLATASALAGPPDAVLPADLLPLVVGPPRVADGDLVDAQPHLGDLGGQLGLDAEPAFLDNDRLDDLRAEGLVADLDVGEVEVVEHVRHQGETAVHHHVPKIQNP